jgi:hypothetical protein
MKLAVSAGTSDGPGIENFITGFKQNRFRTDRLHHTGGIPTEDARCSLGNSGFRYPDFAIHGVYRYRLHSHKQIAFTRYRSWQSHVH